MVNYMMLNRNCVCNRILWNIWRSESLCNFEIAIAEKDLFMKRYDMCENFFI